MTDEKFKEVLKKLLRKTNSDELEWSVAKPDEERLANQKYNVVGPVYKTRYKGRILLLAGTETERVKGSPTGLAGTSSGMKLAEKAVSAAQKAALGGAMSLAGSTCKSVLIVTNPKTGGVWHSPPTGLLDDLLTSVRDQTSKVDEWMDDVLGED